MSLNSLHSSFKLLTSFSVNNIFFLALTFKLVVLVLSYNLLQTCFRRSY